MKELLELVFSGIVQMGDQEHDLPTISKMKRPFGDLSIPIIFTFDVVVGV
jgi:hypothetical protein